MPAPFLRSALLAVTAAVFAAALPCSHSRAQGVDDLPDRPIARAEVIAGAKKQFAMMDANHDGVVSFDEFQRFRVNQPARASQTGTAAMLHVGGHWFERADANGDGKVTLAEAVQRPVGMFDTADVNHDGIVSTAERRLASAFMALGGR